MSSLKEIKGRIASVQNTRKITSAMKMVASSKLHHAQQMIENMLPYEGMLESILKTFLASDADTTAPATLRREVKRVALLVYASNSSLCGGFNGNVIKMMQHVVDDYHKKGVDVTIYPIGRKVCEKVARLGLPMAGKFIELADKPSAHECALIGQELDKAFLAGEVDRVELIYHHFKSAGSQILTNKVLMPINLESAMDYDHVRDLDHRAVSADAKAYLDEQGGHQALEGKSSESHVLALNDNYIVEPDRETILQSLIPRYINLMIYTALLDSNASEHAARMVAMQTATDNADELLRVLNLQYNKQRQYAITAELLDIVGGSMN